MEQDESRFPRDPALVAPTERPEGYFPEREPGVPPFPRGPQFPQRSKWPPWFPFIGKSQCACEASAVYREGQAENPTWPTMYRVPPGGYPAAATLPLLAGSYAIFASANVMNVGTDANVGLSGTLRRIGSPFGPWFDIWWMRLGARWSVNESTRLVMHGIVTLVPQDQGVLLYIGHTAALGDIIATDIWLSAIEVGTANVQNV
jgi:hypothetical protein